MYPAHPRGLGWTWPLLALLLWFAAPAWAQEQATLKGLVVEAHSGNPLVGVNISLEGTVLGVSSTFDGSYVLDKIPPGSYTVVASLIGFGRERRTVTLAAGESRTLQFQLHETTVSLGEIITQGERPYSAASSVALRAFDLRIRPLRSAQDLLQLAPGVFIAQHAGGGKAEQIFLRGFDADHGTDVALSIDGIPVNLVSHGHGQGYADLHFIIPETIEEMQVLKGPYFASQGNLATAGAIAFRTRDHFDHNLLRVEGGTFNTGTLTAIYQIPLPSQHQGAYVAGQFYSTDGPVEVPQGLQRANLFGKFHTHLSATSTLALGISGFSSAWDASGQIPQRAVDRGLITRFGTLDPLEGGTTSRQDANLTYEVRGGDNRNLRIQSYLSRYTFKLFSNFTYFLDNPVAGDMIEQTDDRRLWGLNTHYRFSKTLGPALAATTIGGGFRSDDADVTLWHSPDRIRQAQRVGASINERNLFFWAQEEVVLNHHVRFQLGLRGDYFTFNVDDHLEGRGDGLPRASGYAQATRVSPKANLVLSPFDHLDLFLNAGIGFHSNDARDVVIGARVDHLAQAMHARGQTEVEIRAALEAQGFDPAQRGAEHLPRATGGEVGVRVRHGQRFSLASAVWLMDVDREFVYVGDGGFTELSGATRRFGLDVETRLQLTPWLWADADLTLSTGRFMNAPAGADHIPLAPRLTSTGGLSLQHPAGPEGSLRYRHIGDRPANEQDTVTAEGYTVLDLTATYPIGHFAFRVGVENVLDVAWNEAQFDTESRLFGETEPVAELHFTPGQPRSIRAGVTYRF